MEAGARVRRAVVQTAVLASVSKHPRDRMTIWKRRNQPCSQQRLRQDWMEWGKGKERRPLPSDQEALRRGQLLSTEEWPLGAVRGATCMGQQGEGC